FRNPLLLGLAIWFSKTEPLVLPRDFCYRCFVPLASFFPTGGAAASISVRIRRQLRFCVLRASSFPRRRPVTSAGFSKGSGFYFFASIPVNRLLSAFLTAFRPSAAFRTSSVGRGFYLFAASAVNLLVDCPIFLSEIHLSSKYLPRQCAGFEARGAASTTAAF
ncbi:hypothetical protein, partial [Corallococcus sp. Z5C101001]|uniref:hypothetical protein n=1 Tax=Corallococcus sp. Z5C101001 TaxID=2596829 RepID=UPI00163D42B8